MTANTTRRVLAICAALLVGGAVARAGGDEYDSAKDVENLGPAYFGFVRDVRGTPVSDAQVMLKPKSGDPVMIKTNVLGLYRSHISKETVPDDVAVTCGKEGFKQERVYRRTPPGSKDMFIETDCTLQRL